MQPNRNDKLRYIASAVVLMLGCVNAPKTTPVDDGRARVLESVHALGRVAQAGDVEALNELLTADALTFGPRPEDAFTFRDDVLATLRTHPGKGRLVDGPIDVGLASDGASAWFVALPQFLRNSEQWSPRLTGHLVRVEGRWRFDALHLSLGLADEALAGRHFKAPATLTGADEAGELATLTKHVMTNLVAKLETLSSRPEVALIGSGPTEVYRNGASFKAMVAPQLPALKQVSFRTRFEGPVHSRVAPDGQSGWVAANVTLSQAVGKGWRTWPTFRSLWVFAREDGRWALVQEHQSIGLAEAFTTPQP